MTLEDLNYIAQTVGVVAILGTFVAVLIQMRQTNRLLRNQAKRAQIEGIKAISEAAYQTRDPPTSSCAEPQEDWKHLHPPNACRSSPI